MKKMIFALSCFLLTAITHLYAQSSNRKKIDPISKTNFLAKSNEFNALLTSGSSDYMDKWNELNEMMRIEFEYVKQKIFEAGAAHDNVSKVHFNEQLDKQNLIYREIITMRNDSFRDRNKLNSKLQQYSYELIN